MHHIRFFIDDCLWEYDSKLINHGLFAFNIFARRLFDFVQRNGHIIHEHREQLLLFVLVAYFDIENVQQLVHEIDSGQIYAIIRPVNFLNVLLDFGSVHGLLFDGVDDQVFGAEDELVEIILEVGVHVILFSEVLVLSEDQVVDGAEFFVLVILVHECLILRSWIHIHTICSVVLFTFQSSEILTRARVLFAFDAFNLIPNRHAIGDAKSVVLRKSINVCEDWEV